MSGILGKWIIPSYLGKLTIIREEFSCEEIFNLVILGVNRTELNYMKYANNESPIMRKTVIIFNL